MYFQLSVEKFLYSFLCDMLLNKMTDHSFHHIKGVSTFLSQDKPLFFFPKCRKGWREKAWWLRDGTPREDLLPVPHAAVLPTCSLGQGACGQERTQLRHPGLRPLRSWLQSWLPVRTSPVVNSMALLQQTAYLCDNLSHLGQALHPRLVSCRARRALGKPLGPGFTRGNGCVVFCAACQAKGMSHVCSYCKRDTHTPRQRHSSVSETSLAATCSVKAVRYLHVPINVASTCL